MARFVIMDYDKAMSSMVAYANTADERSAIESLPEAQQLPNRVAVIRTAAIQEFFVLSSALIDEAPTLIVRDHGVVNDKEPPATPEALTASVRMLGEGDEQRGIVVLEWLPGGPDEDLAGFMVYRDGVLIGVAGNLTFADLTASADRHTYDVHAIDNAQNKSQPVTVVVTLDR